MCLKRRICILENIRQEIYAKNRVNGLYCVQVALNNSFALLSQLEIGFNSAFVLTTKSAVKLTEVYSLLLQFLWNIVNTYVLDNKDTTITFIFLTCIVSKAILHNVLNFLSIHVDHQPCTFLSSLSSILLFIVHCFS